jgi:predicted extracellular nuclease
VSADYFNLANGPLTQDWSNLGLITTNDSWTAVPSIMGFRGDDLTGATGTDPTTLTGTSAVVDVNANQTNPDTFSTGGVTEFHIANPTVALTGSGTADAPYLAFYLDATGRQNVRVRFNARDIDGSIDNTNQQLAVQYRIGDSAAWSNVPGGYFSDVSSGPSLATLVTPVDLVLPAAANGAAQLQVRVITTNAPSNDEWIGIDDIEISSEAAVVTLPKVNLSLSSALALESAGTQITLTATATDVLATEQTVQVAVSGSGITAGDYLLSSSTITIPAGQSSGSVTFTVVNDGLAEVHETVQLSLVSPSAGIELGGTSSQTALLVDSTIGARIADIQGASHISPLLSSANDKEAVQNVPGIVTAVVNTGSHMGFFMQDPTPDANAATSDAIFVFTGTAPTVTVGTPVLVSGTVSEVRLGNSTTLTTTEIVNAPAVAPLLVLPWTDAPTTTIVPIVLGTDRVPPTQVINDDFGVGGGNVETGGDFDPVNEGIDFWESLEGMQVTVPAAIAVSPTAHFGTNEEIWVLANGGAGATGRTERGGIAVSAGDFNPERIQIDDLNTGTLLPEVDVGARFADMTGVVSYNFGNYEVLLPAEPAVTQASTLQRETTTLTGSAGALTVGTFNVENLDPGDTTFAAIAAAITNNLGSPDILCVEEIQDNNGPTNNGVVDASVTFQTLIDAIVAAGGPRYEYRQIDPVNGADGGEPGGNIRTGFLFNPDRVDFVEGSLQRLEDPVGGAFQNSRKPLVGEFVFNGEHITVVGNHFNSKGGDQPLFGTNQPPVLSSEVQRMKQATIVADHVDALLADDAGASVIVLGDLNDFEFSNPVAVLEAAGLTSLVETLPVNQRYSYNFEGNAQVLDHIMVSPGLLAATSGFDVVHMNSEFSDQLSDHDPSVARFGIAEQKVLVGRFGADTLVGGDGHDTLTGLQGRDLLIGGIGDDRFVYTAMLDLSDLILDFEPGADTLVVGALLADVGYAGDDPLADGTLGLMVRAGRTYATIDLDGSAGHAAPRVIAELVGVALDELAGVTIFDAAALA